MHKYDIHGQIRSDILTPEWLEDNNDWQKRLAEEMERDGKAVDDLWGFESQFFTDTNVGQNLTLDNATDFISDVIQDIKTDSRLIMPGLSNMMEDTTKMYLVLKENMFTRLI